MPVTTCLCTLKISKRRTLANKLVNVLESAQMLCTAHHCYGDKWQRENVPYKQAHLNHPSTIWVRASVQHYMWL